MSFVCFFLPISFGFAERKNKNMNKEEERRADPCSEQAGGDLVAAAGGKGEKAYQNAHGELVLFCSVQKQIHNVSLQRNGL